MCVFSHASSCVSEVVAHMLQWFKFVMHSASKCVFPILCSRRCKLVCVFACTSCDRLHTSLHPRIDYNSIPTPQWLMYIMSIKIVAINAKTKSDTHTTSKVPSNKHYIMEQPEWGPKCRVPHNVQIWCIYKECEGLKHTLCFLTRVYLTYSQTKYGFLVMCWIKWVWLIQATPVIWALYAVYSVRIQ